MATAESGPTETLTDLERHLRSLAHVQQTDFRAANLFELVARRVPTGARVLDVGCGAGGLVANLLGRGVDAWGIDVSAPAIRAAQGYLESVGQDPHRVAVATVDERLARGEQYDVVVSMDCIEHVADDRAMVQAIARLIRPGGRLVLTVPALMSLYGERDRRIGHFRRYEREGLATLLTECGLPPDELRFWNAMGVAPTWVTQRVLGRNVDESFRFGQPALHQRALRRGLGLWFKHVENRMRPPLGLTLLATSTRASSL